jgi:hypothetical protein
MFCFTSEIMLHVCFDWMIWFGQGSAASIMTLKSAQTYGY